MSRTYTSADGVVTGDLIRCGCDHLTAAGLLFDSNPNHFDAAGYLTHIGVELLMKGWLLATTNRFDDTHSLNKLYQRLVAEAGAPILTNEQVILMNLLDMYSKLRYPDGKIPVEIGNDNWSEIQSFVEYLFRTMPQSLTKALTASNPLTKAGRVLMKRQIVPVQV